MVMLILPHAPNRHAKCLQLQRFTEEFCKSFSVLTGGLCAWLMICKYLHYLCFELCRWLLRYVGEFGHKDSQNASFLVTVITKSLKHHEVISSLRPNEFLSFCLGISSRPLFVCLLSVWIDPLCLSLRICRSCFNIWVNPRYFRSALCTSCMYTYIFIMFWKFYSRVELLSFFFLSLSFCVSVCLFGLNPEHLIRQGLCSHSTIPNCYLVEILSCPVCSHVHSIQSSPSVMN